jgi:uncharacterized protein YkwD
MKIIPLLFFSMISCFLMAQENSHVQDVHKNCLSKGEADLAILINKYRAEYRLSPIPLSASLSEVARIHCQDLATSDAYQGNCNLHSWSDKGKWSSCCYTPDHKHAACMWNKPRELTSYPGDGFEIAYFTTATYEPAGKLAEEILKAWKGSPLHNEIIINQGKWRSENWKAMGVGIWNGYATVWFGREDDPAGEPGSCE